MDEGYSIPIIFYLPSFFPQHKGGGGYNEKPVSFQVVLKVFKMNYANLNQQTKKTFKSLLETFTFFFYLFLTKRDAGPSSQKATILTTH